MPTRSTPVRLLSAAVVLTSLTLVGPAPAAMGTTPAAGLVTAPASGWDSRPAVMTVDHGPVVNHAQPSEFFGVI